MDEWMQEVTTALGLEGEIDPEPLLDLARVVAHTVERKAAPVTTYLVGLAAGLAGGDATATKDAVDRVMDLARSRPQSDRLDDRGH